MANSNNTQPTEEAFLTAKEVKAKIAACIGTTGDRQFRKWTGGDSPVLPAFYFRNNKRPYYALSDVRRALKPEPRQAAR